MRSLFLPDLIEENTFCVTGEKHHHLVHVIRLEESEEVLLTNGRGLSILAKTTSITKKEVRLEFLRSKIHHRKLTYDLALGMPKREALELSLKQAVELGFRTVYLVQSQYSQMRFPDPDRIHALLISALEQSNSPFLPEVVRANWEEIDFKAYEDIFLLSSEVESGQINDKKLGDRLLIVGPEGGFSPSELENFQQQPNIQFIHLPTPILRTPTAVAAGAGLLLRTLMV